MAVKIIERKIRQGLLYLLKRVKFCYQFLPEKTYVKIQYWLICKKKLNLETPVTFNEKIQWLKLYDRNPVYTDLVDKYNVRNWVEMKIGEKYLIPILGIWDNVDEIPWQQLPNQFVLKCTHDSGGVVICKDKSSLKLQKEKRKLQKGLKRNYYYISKEWPYKNVRPRIIAEKYMVDESGKELKDYKCFCFDGKVAMIQVDFDRFASHKRNLYTTKWEYINESILYPNNPERMIEKPKKLDEMLNIASLLSKGFPHVRVDFYVIENDLYFGEMTFYHGSGFEKFSSEAMEIQLGKLIQLPK